jgi:hypothetical protein
MKPMLSLLIGLFSISVSANSDLFNSESGWTSLIGRTFELDSSRSSSKCNDSKDRMFVTFSSQEEGLHGHFVAGNSSFGIGFPYINTGKRRLSEERGMNRYGEWNSLKIESKWDGKTLETHIWGWGGWAIIPIHTNTITQITILPNDTIMLKTNTFLTSETLSLKKDACYFR